MEAVYLTYFHFACEKDLTDAMLKSGAEHNIRQQDAYLCNVKVYVNMGKVVNAYNG